MQILLIEDEPEMASYLISGLSEFGYAVTHVQNAINGIKAALAKPWDLMVIDRILPNGSDGLNVVKALRQAGKDLPIIVLSALAAVDERVRGINAGADDYLTKPFSMIELSARIAVLIKKNKTNKQYTDTKPFDRIIIDDLVINLQNHTAHRGRQQLVLQPREFHLLEYLGRHQSEIVTRTMLLEAIWDIHLQPSANVIEAMVSRLRSKIDRGFSRPLLHTVRGVGYRLGPQKTLTP